MRDIEFWKNAFDTCNDELDKTRMLLDQSKDRVKKLEKSLLEVAQMIGFDQCFQDKRERMERAGNYYRNANHDIQRSDQNGKARKTCTRPLLYSQGGTFQVN